MIIQLDHRIKRVLSNVYFLFPQPLFLLVLNRNNFSFIVTGMNDEYICIETNFDTGNETAYLLPLNDKDIFHCWYITDIAPAISSYCFVKERNEWTNRIVTDNGLRDTYNSIAKGL